MRRLWFVIMLSFACALPMAAQELEPAGGGEGLERQDFPCLSATARREIWQKLRQNINLLELQGRLASVPSKAVTPLAWPLIGAGAAASDSGVHGVSNFVDQNPSYPNFLLDYACGNRTYDLASGYNHKGTDIFLWPFSWWKMDRSEVKIVAAAPGTIIFKQDGQFDRSCGFNSNPWNAVYVQHSNGSIAWYGHMKKGSLTSKGVGATVVAGEVLGVVGSSGSSTGPHLHLELYDATSALIDPYYGACNSLNASSWWTSQRPYYDSAVNMVATHHAPPSFPACPNQEQPNFRDQFAPGSQAYFATYYRDQLAGQVSQYTIERPNGTVFQTWTHSISSPSHYAASYWYWIWTLPSSPLGTWKFKVLYNGKTTVHNFEVVTTIFSDGFESGNLSAWSTP